MLIVIKIMTEMWGVSDFFHTHDKGSRVWRDGSLTGLVTLLDRLVQKSFVTFYLVSTIGFKPFSYMRKQTRKDQHFLGSFTLNTTLFSLRCTDWERPDTRRTGVLLSVTIETQRRPTPLSTGTRHYYRCGHSPVLILSRLVRLCRLYTPLPFEVWVHVSYGSGNDV